MKRAAFVLLFGLGLVFAFVATRTSASEPAHIDAGTLTCTTDSLSYCSNQPHGLGSVPVSVLVTAKAPISGSVILANMDADSFTATTFRVRAFKPNGAAITNTVITYSYAAFSGPAPPPPPPPAAPNSTTGAASSVADTTATLNGTVQPNNSATTCHFDYGTTTSYGTTTADQSAGSGSVGVPVTANVTGLTASTLYHFRLSCSNAVGTNNGGDATFTTTATPPAHWATPFLGRTPSGAVTCDGQSNVTISGLQFVGIGNDVSSIRINNCNNVLITDNDFKDDAQPITVVNSTNVEIAWNRYQNITGPHDRNGSNRANFTQWVGSHGGSIHNNKGIGGDTEDIISIYQSGGTDAAHPLIIENNAFEGTNWSSSGGSGMMLGDDGGSHIIARNNTLLNPGQAGIGVPSGTDIHVLGNTIYGAQRPLSNIGIYVWNQYATPCNSIEVANNRVNWKRADGVANPAWDAGNCGTVAGWDTNDWSATIDPATLHVTL